MASSATFFTVLFFLTVQLHCAHVGTAKSPSFCPLTLSRPTCPTLPTYDAFDITTYGGVWFEIGSTANFKNLQEAGGICVVANYTLQQAPSPGNGAVVGVLNTLFSLGAPLLNTSQIVISLSAGQICSQAFVICAETDPLGSNNLTQGLTLVSNVASQCSSAQAPVLASAEKTIKEAIGKIERKLDELSTAVNTIQRLDAQLGQGQGDATDGVAALLGTVAEANGTAIAIATEVGSIEGARESVGEVAAQLAAKGDTGGSAKLYEAVGLLLAGEGGITAQVGQIQAALASMAGVAGLFLAPATAPEGYNSRIVGVAVQNSTFAGKLKVTFPGFPPGDYWVLAVEDEGGPGYAATLVYGCDQNSSGGGVEETLFVLSRTPTLPKASVHRLLAKAAALGVTSTCSTPFIFTVQSPSCGSPPDIPLLYR